MNKIQRLVLIKTNKNFINCRACNFTWLPMGEKFKSRCPKCEPANEIDDETYLANEAILFESTVDETSYCGGF